MAVGQPKKPPVYRAAPAAAGSPVSPRSPAPFAASVSPRELSPAAADLHAVAHAPSGSAVSLMAVLELFPASLLLLATHVASECPRAPPMPIRSEARPCSDASEHGHSMTGPVPPACVPPAGRSINTWIMKAISQALIKASTTLPAISGS